MAQITKEMLAGVNFDFTKFFAYWKVQIIKSYRNLLTTKKGILGDNAPSNAPSVIARKGKDHWMMDTGDLYKNGFMSDHGSMHLRIFASDKQHSGRYTYMGVPGGHKGQKRGVQRPRTERRIMHGRGNQPTYEQLFLWHNKKGYSGIFGKLAHDSKFFKEFGKEAFYQAKDHLPKEIVMRIEAKL